MMRDAVQREGKRGCVWGGGGGARKRFGRKGEKAFRTDGRDGAELTKALSGARAAYLMSPPPKSREDQERESDAIAKAVTESGLGYAVHLSACGAQVPEGTGPIAALHSSEQKLNPIRGLHVLHLPPPPSLH